MAAIRDVEVDAIEAGRRRLIELTFAHQATACVARKQAVKDLFGTILASWEAGVPFDAMAKALTSTGIKITAATLRSYFFELKTTEQLRAQHAEHERAMTKLRQENDTKQRTRDLQHARIIAQVGNEFAISTRSANVDAADLTTTQVLQLAQRHPIGSTLSSKSARKEPAGENSSNATQRGQSTVAPPRGSTTTQGVPDVGMDPETRVAGIQRPAEVSIPAGASVENVAVLPAVGMVVALVPKPSATYAVQADCSHADAAKTLEEIAKGSHGRKETAFADNLVLRKGNTVWYESGIPFDGYLSSRTLHMLRNVGKVVAPTISRTSKDFVQMSDEL